MRKQKKITIKKSVLPEKLNDKGCQFLCQAVIANAIRSRDTEWMNSSEADLYRTIGFGRTGFNINKIVENYNKNSEPPQKLNIEEVRQDAMNFTLSQLSIKYGRSYSVMRKFCVKHHIAYLKRYDYKEKI